MHAIIKSFLREKILAFDTRTLGLARIAIALLLLFDLAKRASQMSIWYFETGLLPNAILAADPRQRYGWSFFSYVSTDIGVRIAFVLIAAVYVCFLLGIFTRIFHVLSFLCLVSLQARVDLLSNGGDFVFCGLLLWTAFLPLGAKFSLDAWRRRRVGRPYVRSPIVSWAGLAAVSQLAIIYFFNAAHKNGQTWLDGTAVYWMTHQERMVTWLGVWMRENLPLWVFQVLTYNTLVTEYLLFVLIFARWGRPWTSRAAIVLMWSMHLGIAAVANVGVFSFVMLAYSTLLVRSEDWEWLRARLVSACGERSRLVRALTPSPVEPPERPRTLLRWSANAILVYLVIAATSQIIVENPAISEILKYEQPRWLKTTVKILRLNQGWKMFAPDAPRVESWVVVDAVTEDGRHVDPFNELGARVSDPTLRTIPPRLGQNYYFCDYTGRIKKSRAYHNGLADWLFRYHERTGNDVDRVLSFEVYQVTQYPSALGEDQPRDVKARAFLSRQR